MDTSDGRHSLRTCLGEHGCDAAAANRRRRQQHATASKREGSEDEGRHDHRSGMSAVREGARRERTGASSSTQPYMSNANDADQRGDQIRTALPSQPGGVCSEEARRRLRSRISFKRPTSEEEERAWGRMEEGATAVQVGEGRLRGLHTQRMAEEERSSVQTGGRKRLVGKQRPLAYMKNPEGDVRQ